VATLYKGSIELKAPMLFALGFIFLFSIGGLTGLFQGALAVNMHIHDTYLIVGHFHYVMFGGTGMAFFAALHYWYPKMFGRMYKERTAVVAWVHIFVGFNMLYFTMLVLGMQGMPRRYYDHLPGFHLGHLIATVGSWIMVAGLLLMVMNLVRGLFRKVEIPANPWGGVTLEWATGVALSDPAALERAIALYRLVEKYGHDPVNGGYYEVFSRDWHREPPRKSPVNPLSAKSQNTHLHVMEAFTNLLRVWPDAGLKASHRALLELMLTRIYDAKTHHLRLFMTDDWKPRSDSFSYGHDIEAAWLLTEAAGVLGDRDLIARTRQAAVDIAETVLKEGVDAEGGRAGQRLAAQF